MSFGNFHILFFGIVLPVAAILSRRRMRLVAGGSRLRFYSAQIAQMVLLTALSIYVARVEHIALFPAAAPPATAIVAGLLFLAGKFAIGMPLVREAVRERRPIVWLLMPTTAVERTLWIVIALLAGFGEEITWRGVQTALLARYTPDLFTACVIAVVMFAAAHAVQSIKSIAAIAIFAASFHVLVWLSGSLYVAMAVHFAYDAIIGFVYARLAKTMGYTPTGELASIPVTPSDPA